MKGIAVDMLGIMALAVLTIVVGTGLMQSFSMDASKTLPAQMGNAVEDIVNAVFSRGSYDLCEDLAGKKISYAEFKTLLSAMLGGSCNETAVQLDFSMKESDITRIAGEIGASGALLVNTTRTVGAGLILVKGNAGIYPLKYDDTINMTAAGTPKNDVIVEVVVQGCDPYDSTCQMSCSFKAGICDPYCYRANQHEDVPCDIDCVDKLTRDGEITAEDVDGVCDLDCYNGVKDPGRAYDPDCVKSGDGICDPDTNGASDGICDSDCGTSNAVCDPDCADDPDCVCDGGCNGYCSVKCKGELTYPENDPDCMTDEKGIECCGNAVCGFGEDCQQCGDDCPSSGGCGSLGKACCPQGTSIDEFGCTSNLGIAEGKACACDSQCTEGMACSPGDGGGKYCCPRGSKWDGQKCKMEADVLIVAMKKAMLSAYSQSQLQALEGKIGEYQEALASDGLGSMLIYLDGKETSDLVGSKVDDISSTTQIQSVLGQLIPKLKAKYLVIIGGYSRFVQINLACSPCADPNYASFKTDDFYADFTPKDGIPDIPVGRIPDPNNGNMQVLLKALDTYIELHKNGGMELYDYRSMVMLYDQGGSRGPWASGVCAQKAIFGKECNSDSRCTTEGDGGSYSPLSDANGKDFFLLLVHGDNLAPQSFWWDSGNRFITSTDVASVDPKESMWMVMACYAGMIDNKNSMQESVIMEFISRGGAVYFGGTRTQMGRMLGGFSCENGGDNYIGTFYSYVGKKIALGKRIGDVFLEGKRTYSSESKETCSYRTLHQTLLYGDPTLKIKKVWYETA